MQGENIFLEHPVAGHGFYREFEMPKVRKDIPSGGYVGRTEIIAQPFPKCDSLTAVNCSICRTALGSIFLSCHSEFRYEHSVFIDLGISVTSSSFYSNISGYSFLNLCAISATEFLLFSNSGPAKAL